MKEKQSRVTSEEKEKVSLCILLLEGVGKDDSIAMQGYLYSRAITQVTSQVRVGMNQEKQLHQQACVSGIKRGKDVRGEQPHHWIKPGEL